MSREVTLEVPLNVPDSKTASVALRSWLISVRSQIGAWGMDGREVGVGYVWTTRNGINNARLPSVTRRIKRALKSALVVSTMCEPYNLEQRIIYIRDGEPKGTLTIREG
jgi:hypothetical protein